MPWHGYLGLNLHIVWGIIGLDLPNLAFSANAELAQRRQPRASDQRARR